MEAQKGFIRAVIPANSRQFLPNNANSRQRPFAYRTFALSEGGGRVFDIAFERRCCIAVFDIMNKNTGQQFYEDKRPVVLLTTPS